MDINGYPWISMNIHGYPSKSIDINRCPWISMDTRGYPWISGPDGPGRTGPGETRYPRFGPRPNVDVHSTPQGESGHVRVGQEQIWTCPDFIFHRVLPYKRKSGHVRIWTRANLDMSGLAGANLDMSGFETAHLDMSGFHKNQENVNKTKRFAKNAACIHMSVQSDVCAPDQF